MFYNMRTTTAIPTGAKMPYDFEEIIKVPFTMKPYFQVYSNEDMRNDISRYIEYPALITDILEDRAKEFDTLGNRIWFESDIAIENDLVNKAAEKINLNRQFENIVELGMAIPDDIIIIISKVGIFRTLCFWKAFVLNRTAFFIPRVPVPGCWTVL